MAVDPREVVVTRYLTLLAEDVAFEPDVTISDPLLRLRDVAFRMRRREQVVAQAARDFVAYAASWAAANGVTRDAFAGMGVPADVLEAANVAERPPAVAAASAAVAAGEDEVDAAVTAVLDRAVSGAFSAAELARVAGVGVEASQEAIGRMLAASVIESAGRDPWFKGKGRRPEIYIRSRKAALV